LRPVGLGMVVARVGETVLEPAVAGEQHETFAVTVEAADGVDVGDVDEIGERVAPAFRVTELANDVERSFGRGGDASSLLHNHAWAVSRAQYPSGPASHTRTIR
jgi:hypothetical protein